MRADLSEVLGAVPTLKGVLARAMDTYLRLGRVGGKLSLADAEMEQAGLLGMRLGARGDVTLAELDRALAASRLQRGLVAVLEEIAGAPLVPRPLIRQAEAERAAAYVARLRDALTTVQGRILGEAWIARDASYLRSVSSADDALRTADLVGCALSALPVFSESEEMLAHFAARLAGNAHAFDPGEEAGRLLLRAIGAGLGAADEVEGEGIGKSEFRERTLARAGLLVDDVSSVILVSGLAGDPVLDAATATGMPLALPLYTVTRLADIRPALGTVVFAVENPPVFRILHERASGFGLGRRPALVCTSGHMSLAAERLLKRVAGAGNEVLYSGDFDLRGLEIAFRAMRAHPGRITLWRMDEADHGEALRRSGGGRGLTARERERLATHSPAHAAMLGRGTAHQEALSERLWQDVARYVSASGPGPAI